MPATPSELNTGLEGLLEQLASLAGDSCPAAAEPDSVSAPPANCRGTAPAGRELPLPSADAATTPVEEMFLPAAPRSLADLHVAESEVENIILRLLMQVGKLTGLEISQRIGVPFPVTEKVLHVLKIERLLIFKSAATLSDFMYEITDEGLHRAVAVGRRLQLQRYRARFPGRLLRECCPQSLSRVKPRMESLRPAFADLTISSEMSSRLGRPSPPAEGSSCTDRPATARPASPNGSRPPTAPASGFPARSACGVVIWLFDPSCHEELPWAKGERIVDDEKIDDRWVRIRRPTIVVGGELSLESLEITVHKEMGIGEAPIQMKSNCGTLVIDDFGRQRVPPQKLLNRWIVPLESQRDYLGLTSGRKICVPFDQFIVFSTNLEPRELVDEAFLRRIPYKIEVENPTVEQFRKLFELTCQKQGIAYDGAALDHLIARHYGPALRPMRFCHARDMLHQVGIFCRFRGLPPAMSVPAMDAAATDYFSVMGG